MMANARERSNSISHMLASLALQLVRDDPELIERYRELCKAQHAPFDPDGVNELVLVMAETAVNEAGLEILRGRQSAPRVMHIPLPLGEDDSAASASALAIGSFTTEFVHAVPGKIAEFEGWLMEQHPDCGWTPGDFTEERLVDADHTLTIMAHVTSEAHDSGALGQIQEHARRHAHHHDEPPPFTDDGTRHV